MLSLLFPFALIILIQLGSKTEPNKAINPKTIGIRILIAIIIFTAVSLLKFTALDAPIRDFEVNLIVKMMNGSAISKGALILGKDISFEIPPEVLRTSISILGMGLMFGLFMFFRQPWMTVIMGVIGFIVGSIAKVVKDLLFCMFLFNAPTIYNENHYLQFTKTAIVLSLAFLVLLSLIIVYTKSEKTNVKMGKE